MGEKEGLNDSGNLGGVRVVGNVVHVGLFLVLLSLLKSVLCVRKRKRNK
jgi:hypothetical protein